MPEIIKWFSLLGRKVWPPRASLRRKVLLLVVAGLSVILIFGVILKLVPQPEPETTDQGTVETQGGTGDNSGDTAGQPDGSDAKDDQKTDPPQQQDTNPPAAGGADGGSAGDTQPGNSGGSGGGTPSSCPLPDYPNEGCTGVPAGTALTVYSGDYEASSGEVITNMRITGDLFIGGNGVTIRNSEIYGEVKNAGSTNNTFTMEDSTIGAPTGCNPNAAVGENNFTLSRVRIRGFGEGPRISDGGNVVIRDSLIKLCNPGGDAHSDGIQGYFGGSNIIIEHNTIDTVAAMETITANIFWADSSGNNVQFNNNMLAGGGYTIRIHEGTGHTVSGNKVVNNSWFYGPVSSGCGAISWSNNHLVTINANYQITGTIGAFGCEE